MTAKDNAIKLADWLLGLADREKPHRTNYDTCTTSFEYAALGAGFKWLGAGYFADVFFAFECTGLRHQGVRS